MNPEAYGVTPQLQEISFANNDVDFIDETGIDHNIFSYGLKKSLYNFMHGIGFDMNLQEWFDFEIPNTTISEHYIEDCIYNAAVQPPRTNAIVVWIGHTPELQIYESEDDSGDDSELVGLTFFSKTDEWVLETEVTLGQWIHFTFSKFLITQQPPLKLSELQADFEASGLGNFDGFLASQEWKALRENGLLLL